VTDTDTSLTQRTRRWPRVWRVVSDKLELPRGSFFTTLAGVPVKTGDLALFSVGSWASVGRWYSFAGVQWIRQPRLLIVGDSASLRIWGPVIRVDMTVKQITNLRPEEYERFYSNPFPRMLDL
jgi:hypothetical protein